MIGGRSVRPEARPCTLSQSSFTPVHLHLSRPATVTRVIAAPDRRRHAEFETGDVTIVGLASEETVQFPAASFLPTLLDLQEDKPEIVDTLAAELEGELADVTVDEAHLVYTDKELLQELKECTCADDVLDIVEDEAELFSPASLSTAVTRLKSLSKSLSMQQKKAIQQHASIPRLLELTALHISNMESWQFCQTLHSLVTLGLPLSNTLLAQFSQLTATKLWKFNGKDASKWFRSYAVLGVNPGKEILDLVGFQAQSLLDKGEFEPASVSILLHSCALLGYKNDFLFKAAVRSAVKTADEFAPQGVANIVWALGKLKFHSPAICKKAAEYVINRYLEFTPQEINNLFWGFGVLRYHPSEAMSALTQHMQAYTKHYKPADITSLFHVLGVFSYALDATAIDTVTTKTISLLTLLKPMELCTIFWSLAMSEQTQQPLFQQVAELLPDLYEREELNDAGLRMILQGYIASKVAETPLNFPVLMLDSMKRCWVSTLAAEPSHVHSEIGDVLKALKVRHDCNRRTRDGLAAVDFALKPSRDRFVALQILWENDYCANTGQLVSAARFRRTLLEQNGWEVRQFRIREYLALPMSTRPNYVKEELDAVGYGKLSLPPGYKLSPGGNANSAVPQRRAWGSDSDSAATTGGFKPSETELIMDVAGKSLARNARAAASRRRLR